MSDPKENAYRKDGGEYVFTLKDEHGNTITARAKIANGGESDVKVEGDTLALFPQRSSNHARIKAFLEQEKRAAAELAKAQALNPGRS